MVIKWIIWRNYIRWKDRWKNLKIFNNYYKGGNYWKLYTLYELIYSFFIFFGSFTIFSWLIKGDSFKLQLDNAILQFLLENVEILRSDPNIIWILVSFAFFLFSISSGLKAANWAEESKGDWLFQNVIKLTVIKRFALVAESLVWSSRELLFKIFPVIMALSLLTRDALQIPLVLIYLIVIFATFSFMIAYLYILIMQLRIYASQQSLYSLITPIFIRLIAVVSGYYLFNYFKAWIVDLPFLRNNLEEIKGEDFNKWLLEGMEVGLNLISPLWELVVNKYSPFLYLVNFSGPSYISFFVVLLSYSLILCFVIFFLNLLDKNFHSIPSNNKNSYKKFSIINFIPKKFKLYYKISVKTDYSIKRYPNYMGSLLFWFLVSGFSTVTNGLETDSKLYIMCISFLIFYPIYFWIVNSASNLCGILALESDGRHALIYFSAGKSLWDIFVRKFTLFTFIVIPVLLIEIVVVGIIGNINSQTILLILFSKIVFILFSIYITFIASIYSPHFEFNNPDQILDYPDRKIVDQLVNYLVIAMIIPLFMLPTVLYLADSLSYANFVFGQYFAVPVAILFLTITALKVTYRKLKKITKIDNLSI